MEHYHGSEDILDEHREFSMPTDLIAKLKGVGHSVRFTTFWGCPVRTEKRYGPLWGPTSGLFRPTRLLRAMLCRYGSYQAGNESCKMNRCRHRLYVSVCLIICAGPELFCQFRACTA